MIAHLAARCAGPDAPCWPGALRTARGASGAILIDRGTKDFSAYCVTAAGVGDVDAATVERENVRFLRLEGARPLETADPSATFPEAVAELAKLIHFAYPEDAWVLGGQLLASWVPDVSYSMFLFVGPPGAGKTSAARETKNHSRSRKRPGRIRRRQEETDPRPVCVCLEAPGPYAGQRAGHLRREVERLLRNRQWGVRKRSGRCTRTATRR